MPVPFYLSPRWSLLNLPMVPIGLACDVFHRRPIPIRLRVQSIPIFPKPGAVPCKSVARSNSYGTGEGRLGTGIGKPVALRRSRLADAGLPERATQRLCGIGRLH